MSGPPDLAFVACIEAGALERQALLLFESIRAYAGGLAHCPIYALAPRAGLGVGRATRRRLEALGVEYLDTVLNTECVDYGSTNRVVAAAHIEATRPHEILVVLDSDTLVLREPEAFRLAPDVDVAVRPVDYKGVCTAGPEDPYDGYWRRLCEVCGVSYDEIPWIQSYVDDVRVKASYNGGLVVVRSDRGILRRWSELFLASVRAGLRPRAEALAFRSSTGAVAAPASRMWGSNQAALSLAMWSTTRQVLTLDPTYNYPLHGHADLRERRATDFDRLVHVHYHWLFEPDAIAGAWITSPESTLAAEKLAWLRARTPFQAAAVSLTREGSHATVSSLAMTTVPKPVVIVGMHRSGTSLTASILGSAGLHLGDELVPAGPGNAEGHFEDREFVEFHRTTLQTLGHDPEGWDETVIDGLPDGLEARAQALIEARASRPLWGWKDPRTALFLPFWERLLPEARFVFVYRTPWEVIDSLYRRGDRRFRQDPAASARLWSHYNRAILASLSRMPERAILFNLEDITADPNAFVEQVSRAFGLRLDPPADLFKPDLLHRGGSLADWRALSESVLSSELALLKRLDDTAQRLARDAASAEPVEPRAAPEGALLRQWAALRETERMCDESRAAVTARRPDPLCLYMPSQGIYSEVTTLVDVLPADGQTRDYMFLVHYDGSAPLRLDVGASVGMVELEAVTVRSRETGAVIAWSGRALDQAPFRLVNAIRTSGRRDDAFCFLSLNEDAQLYVDLPDTVRFQGACQVDIAVGFRASTGGPVPRAAAALLREMTAVTKANAVLRAQLAGAETTQRETGRRHELTLQQHAAAIDDLNRCLADSSRARESRERAIAALEGRLSESDDRWQRTGARLASSEAALAEQGEQMVRRGLALDRLQQALVKSERHVEDLSRVLATLQEGRAYRLGRLITYPWRRLASAVAAPVNGGRRSPVASPADLACLAQTPLFDEAFYLASNPDVRATDVDARMHYLRYGAAEGRDPGPRFRTAFYLAQYPDVKAARINPLVHYVTVGAQEGRLPRPLSEA